MTVSVIIPTYNRLATLPRAVRSTLDQTYEDLEVIVVDDASTDGTVDWLHGLDDPRVSVVVRPERRGPAAARNAGVARARSSVIAFIDSDDEWLEDKIESQLAVLDSEPDIGLVGCAWSTVRDGVVTDSAEPDARMRPSRWTPDAVYDFPFITSTWLVRRELIEVAGGFDEQLPNLEDWELIFRMYGRAGFHIVERCLVRKHATSDGHDLDQRSRWRSFETIVERHGAMWRDYPETLARHWMELSRLRKGAGHPIGGYAALWRARLLHHVATQRAFRALTPMFGVPR